MIERLRRFLRLLLSGRDKSNASRSPRELVEYHLSRLRHDSHDLIERYRKMT
jgi:hypothetical protein